MKYGVGDKVIHFRNGLSTIVRMTEMAEREYYIVHTLRGDGENIYVPIIGCDNIIRPIMDIDSADKLLSSLKNIKLEFNTNTKQRRDAYKKRLSSGKVEDVAFLMKQHYLYIEHPECVKLGPTDIDMLSFATTNLLDELALTYSLDRDKIEAFILEKIKS